VTVTARFAMLARVRGGLPLSRASTVLFRLTLMSALAAGLAACGRKGPLDLPPTAAAAPAEQTTASPLVPPIGTAPTAKPAQASPTPPNRSFVLDPLLN
jgi:predicted small lipoprotein YifL